MQSLSEDVIDFAAARAAMINSQLRTSGVNAEWVLARMRSVPREDHVPAHARAAAYTDRAIRLDDAHSLAAPVFYGMMLQEARPLPDDRVLIVSPAPGYLAELVRPLVASVEVLSPAEAVEPGDGSGDATLLLIDGAAEQIPPALAARLTADGRAVGGIIRNGVQRLANGRPAGGALAMQPILEMGIPPLPELAAPKGWRF